MRKRKKIFASIDLGSEGVRLLIAQKKFKNLKILVNKTYSMEEIHVLSQQIQTYAPREVIMLLPTERVLVRDVTLPPAEKKRIKSMLYFELAGRIPYAIEQIQLDYILLERTRREIKVKAFIIPEAVHKEVEQLKRAGIMINRLLPRGLALTEYLQIEGLENRLVRFVTPNGELVVYPSMNDYFSRFYHLGQSIDEQELKDILSREGAKPDRWDLMELTQADADLLGAVRFCLKNRTFNLLSVNEVQNSYNSRLVGFIVVLIAILLVNAGTFYLRYMMARNELQIYQERLAMLIPRTEKIKKITDETHQLAEKFDSLQTRYLQTTDYLIWLKQLHLLLQEDTEVNILVLEDNLLREMHGTSSSATRVSARLADSEYFTKAELTAPITTKEVEDKLVEEFNITAVLLNPHQEGVGADE